VPTTSRPKHATPLCTRTLPSPPSAGLVPVSHRAPTHQRPNSNPRANPPRATPVQLTDNLYFDSLSPSGLLIIIPGLSLRFRANTLLSQKRRRLESGQRASGRCPPRIAGGVDHGITDADDGAHPMRRVHLSAAERHQHTTPLPQTPRRSAGLFHMRNTAPLISETRPRQCDGALRGYAWVRWYQGQAMLCCAGRAC
jgi:hypothetical protein